MFRCREKNRSGIILLVALWILGILSVLAIGLGRRTAIDLSLTRYTVGKVKANHLAWAGLMYAMNQIQKDTNDLTTNSKDTLYQCGITLDEGQRPEDIFKEISLGEGYFDIRYVTPDSKEVRYGLEDEERRLNINALNQQNDKALSNLIVLLGFDEEAAATIAASVVDWRDEDSTVTNPPFGGEDNDYMALAKPFHCKNLPFDSIEELLLVKGMTPQIFQKLKDYVTVFPQEARALLVNLETAPEIIIRALARSVAGPITNTEIADSDSLASKLLAYRRGEDSRDFTADDRSVDENQLGLNAKEMVIFLAIKAQTTSASHYLRMHIRGVEGASSVHSDVEAVVYRDDLSIVYWHRD